MQNLRDMIAELNLLTVNSFDCIVSTFVHHRDFHSIHIVCAFGCLFVYYKLMDWIEMSFGVDEEKMLVLIS